MNYPTDEQISDLIRVNTDSLNRPEARQYAWLNILAAKHARTSQNKANGPPAT